jgi:cation:H+ antiporter
LRKKSDVAIGGVVGSNIFNLLAVAGAAGLAGGFEFSDASLRFDLPVMLLATLAVAAFVLLRRDIGRGAGLLMSAAYLAFLFALLLSSGGGA